MISWHVFNSSTCWEINSGNYQVPGNLHGNPTQTLAGQSAFMLRTVSASQFPFSGLSSEDDRVAQAVGVPWWVTSTEGAELPQMSPGTLTSAGQLKSFQLCRGCMGDGDFVCSTEAAGQSASDSGLPGKTNIWLFLP